MAQNIYEKYLAKEELGVLPSVEVVEDEKALPERVPARISPRHKQVLILHALGFSPQEISVQTGYSENTIPSIIQHPDAQKMLDEMTRQLLTSTLNAVQNKIVTHADEAVGTMVGLMRTAKSEVVRQTSAKDILDRAGLKGREFVQGEEYPLDPESAALIADAIREERKPVKEYPPIGNSAEIEEIRNAVRDEEDIKELIGNAVVVEEGDDGDT